MRCSLCKGFTTEFLIYENRKFVQCEKCKAILLLPEFFLNAEVEKSRYALHNNDVTDPRYKNFVSPITSHITENFPTWSTGLDFGCGTGPVAAVELQKRGYSVKLYDPFFEDHPEVLSKKYNFIICCEVMEHFHHSHREFQLLSNLLLPGGKLYCKTILFFEK